MRVEFQINEVLDGDLPGWFRVRLKEKVCGGRSWSIEVQFYRDQFSREEFENAARVGSTVFAEVNGEMWQAEQQKRAGQPSRFCLNIPREFLGGGVCSPNYSP